MSQPHGDSRRHVARFIAGEGEASPPGPEPTQISKYKVLRLLGRGGSASVYEAMDQELRRKVALKVLREEHADERHVKRFQREASIAAQLQHPNIVPVFEIGLIPQGENRYLHFIAMALVEGVTLDDHVAAEKPGPAEIARLVEEAARAADYAHRKGVIHRDLKSANIMVERGGRVLLMDFGLARATTFETKLTRNAAMLGTPAYMSPEQVQGDLRRIGPTTDVYALGIILYELLTGRVPFEARAAAELFFKIVNRDPAPPSRAKKGIPAELETICLKAIEKDQRHRYASAADLADDLARFRTGAPILAQPVGSWSKLSMQMRRRAPAVAGVLLLVAAAVGVTVLLTRRDPATPAAADPGALRREQKRADAHQRIALLAGTLQERKRELRALRISAAQARRDLEAVVAEAEGLAREWPDLPQPPYLAARGKGYLGRLEEAESELLRLLGRHPEFRPGWSLVGMLRLEIYQRGRWGYDGRSTRAPENLDAIMEGAIQAFAQGWPEGREREESQRWKLPWNREDEINGRLAGAARHLGADRLAEAERVIEKSMREFQAEEYALWMIRFQKDAAGHLRWLDRALELAPGYSTAARVRGVVRKSAGDLAGALKDLDRALELEPGSPAILINRAQIHEDLGNRELALRDLDEILKIQPDHFGARNNRGTLKAKAGEYAGALEDFDAALAGGAEDPGTLCNRARCRSALNDPQGALKDVNRALELAPKIRGGSTLRGRIRTQMGDVPGAMADYQRAIEVERDFDAGYYRALLHQQSGDYRSALRDLDFTLQHPQPTPDAYAMRGFVRLQLKEFIGAEADLAEALRRAPAAWPQRATVEGWLGAARRAR